MNESVPKNLFIPEHEVYHDFGGAEATVRWSNETINCSLQRQLFENQKPVVTPLEYVGFLPTPGQQDLAYTRGMHFNIHNEKCRGAFVSYDPDKVNNIITRLIPRHLDSPDAVAAALRHVYNTIWRHESVHLSQIMTLSGDEYKELADTYSNPAKGLLHILNRLVNASVVPASILNVLYLAASSDFTPLPAAATAVAVAGIKSMYTLRMRKYYEHPMEVEAYSKAQTTGTIYHSPFTVVCR